jgi:hypothetical protein
MAQVGNPGTGVVVMADTTEALKAAFFALLILALAIAIYGHYHPPPTPPPQPQLVTNQPAGLYYNGPPTTALAGWYCIESINSSNGYSIQLNALLNNGLFLQDVYVLPPGYSGSFYELAVLRHGSFLDLARGTGFINAPCAWLVMAINDGNAYFGYSLDGESIVWYGSYPVGNATIEPGPSTELVLAGYGYGLQAQLGSDTLVRLALYYWNGTGWAPAPVGVFSIYSCTGRCTFTTETVNNAYVYTNNVCGGVVSWPNAVNETVCPSPPSFRP